MSQLPPGERAWPHIDVTDYRALARERSVLLGRLAAIEEFMREINGKNHPCTDPGGHASEDS
jgi:hypothetical protein